MTSLSWARAKSTTSTVLAVAVPMHMMAPVSAGTESVVPVRNRLHVTPARAAGSAQTTTNGSSQDWKLTTITRNTSTIDRARPVSSCP